MNIHYTNPGIDPCPKFEGGCKLPALMKLIKLVVENPDVVRDFLIEIRKLENNENQNGCECGGGCDCAKKT